MSWAGSERCVEQMLQVFPQADLVVGLLGPSMREYNKVTRHARETWLARVPFARGHHRWFLPIEGFAFASLRTRGYDLVISSSHAMSKMVRCGAGTAHLCYCYSPPRYLWHLSTVYQQYGTATEAWALKLAGPPLRWLDRRAAAGVDHFVGISHFVRQQIRRTYARDADVLYPPVQAKAMVGAQPPREDFLLYLGRLVSYKRVDLAVSAASRLGVRLVVAGEGPERRRLERIAGPRIEFLGEVSEEQAADLLSRSAAFVFCAEEDFGITPIEANAHGTPVVAYRSGGVTETMIDGRTAEFFEVQSVDAVVSAVRRVLARPWDTRVMVENAARFEPAHFRSGLASIAEAVLARRATVG